MTDNARADGEASVARASAVLQALGIQLDVAAFERDGCAIVRGFAKGDECDAMRKAMGGLVDAWDPSTTKSSVFRTDKKQETAQGSSDYFLDSANKIHFFMEPDAVDDSDGSIKGGLTKDEVLNKVGHGLHVVDPTFATYAQSPKVAALARALGWRDPVLPQSMYIFKQPRIGGEVTSHQDSTFLFTEPRQTCLGLWLALEKATEENGCVWGRPGSHNEPVRRRFRRNPEWFEKGNKKAPQMLFDELAGPGSVEASAAPWEGAMPPGTPKKDAVAAAGFVPLLCDKGDLVLIHGSVDHLSLANTSAKSRHTFQLHLVEGPKQGIQWSGTNWLQYPDGQHFPTLALPNDADTVAAAATNAPASEAKRHKSS